MPYLHWIFIAIYALLVIGTMVTVLMDNRQPAKATAWILVLLFIPAIGIILYIFFGQNTRKERFINQKSLDQLTKRSMLEFAEQTDLVFPENHQTLIHQFINQNWALPFKDNDVDIYTTGHDFFLALLQAIGRARHHIHLETYIIADDPLGYLIADALIDKAREGVEVRLIYDDVGCWRVPSSFFERMRHAGIDLHAFMPVHFPAFTSKINYRNHRKICVIDGCEGFIGGMNIALRYIIWRDTHLRVCGGAVYALQRTFLIDWYFVDRTLITSRKYYPELGDEQRKPCLAQVVTSSPISPWPDIMQGYVRILLEAKQYVYIETPYFLPTDPILFAIPDRDVRRYHADHRHTDSASVDNRPSLSGDGLSVQQVGYLYGYGKGLICVALIVNILALTVPEGISLIRNEGFIALNVLDVFQVGYIL